MWACKFTGDPLHNLTEIHTTQQHTTELHTTQRHGGVPARLCAICPGGNVGWPHVGSTSVLSSRRWANVSPTYIAVWLVSLWRVTGWRTQTSQHTTERQGCVQLGGVLLGHKLCVIRLGCVEGHPWNWGFIYSLFICEMPFHTFSWLKMIAILLASAIFVQVM